MLRGVELIVDKEGHSNDIGSVRRGCSSWEGGAACKGNDSLDCVERAPRRGFLRKGDRAGASSSASSSSWSSVSSVSRGIVLCFFSADFVTLARVRELVRRRFGGESLGGGLECVAVTRDDYMKIHK